jgi:hypothetical protein
MGNATEKKPNEGWVLALIMLVGAVARMQLASFGHNYDFQSYQIVGDLLYHGDNVYAGTSRYNYGPVWFNILQALDFLSGHRDTIFRYLIAALLSLVDAGICLVLWRKFGLVAAGFFILNPVSMIISGFHSQFDNLAILLGLFAMLVFGNDFEQPVGRRKVFGLLLLGLSLMTKHVLFAFPCWLAVKQKGFANKFLVVFLPVAVFLAGFIPYWRVGEHGIIQNVFLYRSVSNEYFYDLFLPPCLQHTVGSLAVWLACLGAFAFICRKKDAIDSLLFYTAVLVATSPAITNQYLAIPVAFIAIRTNCLTVLYTLVATVHLITDQDGLHILGILPAIPPNIPVYVLVVALVWVTWRLQIIAAAKFIYNWLKFETENQVGAGK